MWELTHDFSCISLQQWVDTNSAENCYLSFCHTNCSCQAERQGPWTSCCSFLKSCPLCSFNTLTHLIKQNQRNEQRDPGAWAIRFSQTLFRSEGWSMIKSRSSRDWQCFNLIATGIRFTKLNGFALWTRFCFGVDVLDLSCVLRYALKHHATCRQWCPNPDHYPDSEPPSRLPQRSAQALNLKF